MRRRHALQSNGYHLTMAEIVYRLPDYPALVQTFIWQGLDLAPKYPELNKFLDFWDTNIEGPIHSVTVASKSIAGPAEIRVVDKAFTLH